MVAIRDLIALFPEALHKDIAQKLQSNNILSLSGAGNVSSKVFIIADLFRTTPQTILWIVNDITEQEALIQALKLWMSIKVVSLDLDENITNDKIINHKNKEKILTIISALHQNIPCVVVTTMQTLLQRAPQYKDITEKSLTISLNEKVKTVEVFQSLIGAGYEVSSDFFVQPGQYHRQGDLLYIFPLGKENPVCIEFAFDEVVKISDYNQEKKEFMKEHKKVNILPLNIDFHSASLLTHFSEDALLIQDELEIIDQFIPLFDAVIQQKPQGIKTVFFTSFFDDVPHHTHVHYLSILKYQGVLDLVSDFHEKAIHNWCIFFLTKNRVELEAIFKEKGIDYDVGVPENQSVDLLKKEAQLHIIEVDKDAIFPPSFQTPKLNLALITDRDVADLHEKRKTFLKQKLYQDFLTSLKLNDYVVHVDHGIGVFMGLDRRTVDSVTREYLKIGYAENDRLFVPIDQADKVNKFIGAGDEPPRLTRLGSAEWATLTSRVKKETQKIAKELLILYAQRQNAKGHIFKEDNDVQKKFEETFPYEETPGQLRAILDVKADMEREKPMDRLVCGDVGFGKTEVAMRAAFKSVQSGSQVAFISPITILADQHYHSFKKRMEEFHVRVEMLSRFRTQKEQSDILRRIQNGEVDIVIGTHRLLQPDVDFKNLGLLIIDEEQRFGVKQKEMLKEKRSNIDVLTLTATPIPRTLNISLHGLRDITTITTPPPGRLPIITEVRRFSYELIRDAIMRELDRKGQIYFLHNRVQTIDSIAEKLKSLVPEARIVVSHGKLQSTELEKRILAFKDGLYDILVSSTIIENGIDLSNANTLIVNNAEKFGLAQLYQLRGRVGRGKQQAYAYFLYQAERLPLDAKRRLRAIVEASELGSGFQIAMKDLEIRGAGDILGANQHGAINVVGVSHFIRMLNQAVEELKAGGKLTEDSKPPQEVSIELPLPAFIPDSYIIHTKEKIMAYQRMSSADNFDYLRDLKNDMVEDYGKMPREVVNLFRVLELKIFAKKANITNVKAENIHDDSERQIVLTMSDRVRPANIINLLEYNATWQISGTKLKIKITDLGVNWVEELRECLKRLGDKVKRPVEAKEIASKSVS